MFQCFMFYCTSVMVLRVSFLHIPVFWCYLLPCTLLSLLQVIYVEGVFNSVVAGKFVRYFRPSWRSTRFLPESPNHFSFYLWKNISAQERPASKKVFFFFNNWAISRALIGECSIRVRTMEITWWWHNLFFSFSRVRFSVKSERKWTSKLSIESFRFENENECVYEI